VREVRVAGRRYIVCLNEEERRKDAHDRAAIVDHLRRQLKQGDKSLVGNKGYRRFLKLEGEGHFAVDEDRIKARNDSTGSGFCVRTPTTTPPRSPLAYKGLWMVEDTNPYRQVHSGYPADLSQNATRRSVAMSSAVSWPLRLKAELETTSWRRCHGLGMGRGRAGFGQPPRSRGECSKAIGTCCAVS